MSGTIHDGIREENLVIGLRTGISAMKTPAFADEFFGYCSAQVKTARMI
jgi:hypothetical protein